MWVVYATMWALFDAKPALNLFHDCSTPSDFHRAYWDAATADNGYKQQMQSNISFNYVSYGIAILATLSQSMRAPIQLADVHLMIWRPSPQRPVETNLELQNDFYKMGYIANTPMIAAGTLITYVWSRNEVLVPRIYQPQQMHNLWRYIQQFVNASNQDVAADCAGVNRPSIFRF